MQSEQGSVGITKKILIVGGGTAGWMTAAAFAKVLGKERYKVTLIESENIGTVGVGEATIPGIKAFNDILGIDENIFLKKTKGTFKLGIEFVNWGELGNRYMHPFGSYGMNIGPLAFYHYWQRLFKLGKSERIDEFSLSAQAALQGKFAPPLNVSNTPLSQIKYAYHFDAGLYAKLMREYAEKGGVERIEGEIEKVNLQENDGYIKSVSLRNGVTVDADFYIDCSGFRSLLIGQALKTGFESWSDYLLCDSAIAVQTQNIDAPLPYTRSIALSSGWQWCIPLQHRSGNGHVYSSKYISDDEASASLLKNLNGEIISSPRLIKFTPGVRNKFWNKNCVAIGLSSGFLEPLESTSIYLIQQSIIKLFSLFPTDKINLVDVDKYNDLMHADYRHTRDFVVLHYKASKRTDSEFWRYCKFMDIPESLKKRIALYEASGRIFRENNECFAEESWITVMSGQGLSAKDYNPLVDVLNIDELERFSKEIKNVHKKAVSLLPRHQDFIAKFCSAEKWVD